MKAVLRLASLTSCPSLWHVTFPQDVELMRQNAKIKFNVVYCNIHHLSGIYVLPGVTSQSLRKKCKYCPTMVPTKPGYKGFEITDCFILVNDPEATESCNNGQLFPFLMHSYDYLAIVNDGRMVGKYCGQRTGETLLLTGDQILITIYSDEYVQKRGFLIHFTVGPDGKYFS